MWQNILKVDKLQTGDVLRVSSNTPFFSLTCDHYAVVFFKNDIPYVTHCVSNGPITETLQEFEKKRTIYSHFRNEITKKLTDEFIQQKAAELQAYGYNFMEMNCEDYVKRIVGTYIGLDDRVTLLIIISITIIIALTSIIIYLRIKR